MQDHNSKTEPLPSAKWFLSVNDRRIPAPRRIVDVSLIRAQASIPSDHVIVRDHNSSDDEVLEEGTPIDLANGNVFYTVPRCEARSPARCNAPAKIAFSIDDRVEETLNRSQSANTLLDLFGIERSKTLIRDRESPVDDIIKAADSVLFEDGPVFYTRGSCESEGLEIIVNSRRFGKKDGVRPSMTPREIAGLISKKPEDFDTYAGAVATGTPLPPDQPLKIKNHDVFTVVKKEVVGGYSADRIKAELSLLEAGGAAVGFFEQPVPAVVYRGLPVREGLGITTTDVLVPVPSGYPGQHLDWAYLPDGSPLLGRVVGSPQGSVIAVDGRNWRQVSYHPHTGGGFPAWNPNLFGFHTYVDALIAWLARWK